MECKTCKYHDDFTWVCFNPDAEDRADFTEDEHVCEHWVGKDGTE